jgi:hypothetical protein
MCNFTREIATEPKYVMNDLSSHRRDRDREAHRRLSPSRRGTLDNRNNRYELVTDEDRALLLSNQGSKR